MTAREDQPQRIAPDVSEDASIWETFAFVREVTDHSGLKRRDIRELGESGDAAHVPTLIAILREQTNENNRETAARSLGMIGGEAAATALELTCHYGDDSRWVAKRAAANALRKMDLWYDDAPLLDPRNLGSVFKQLKVVGQPAEIQGSGDGRSTVRESKLEQAVTTISRLSGLEMITDISPHDVNKIVLRTKDSIDLDIVAERAEAYGLNTHWEQGEHSKLLVAGSNWPGLGSEPPHLAVVLTTDNDGFSIETSGLPRDLDCENWISCIRFLARFSRWLAWE